MCDTVHLVFTEPLQLDRDHPDRERGELPILAGTGGLLGGESVLAALDGELDGPEAWCHLPDWPELAEDYRTAYRDDFAPTPVT